MNIMDTIDQIINSLNKLYGAPAVTLVFLSCIAVGYVIRGIKRIDNSAIPTVVVLWGALAMSLIADSRASNMTLRVWIVRNILVGVAIGFAAWLSHRFLLARIENWITSKFPQAGNTQFFKGKAVDMPEEQPKTTEETKKP